MKKLFAVLLATVIFLCGIAALAENAAVLTGHETSAGSGLTNEKAAEGYIRSALAQPAIMNENSVPRQNAVGTKLTGGARNFYNLMRPLMVKAAAGKISSTEFEFKLSDMTENVTYTAEELGFSTTDDTDAIFDAFLAKTGVPQQGEISDVINALMTDMPYEMYWFDKTQGWSWSYPGQMCAMDSEGNVSFRYYEGTSISVSMAVAQEYSANNTVGSYAINTKLGQAVTDAAANIRTILADNKSKSDYDKLKAYRDWIRDHVEYNHSAADDNSTPYGNPRQQLWGMVFFLAAQIFYAVFLHSAQKNKYLLIGRILLVLLVEVIAGIILKDKLDLLAIVSVCYYVNLIMNMLTAFSKFRQHPLLAIGFAFFILCDTIIGLQVAAEGYLPIGTDTLLYQVLFIDFNLAWVFYLPSQVLIALSTIRHKK